MGKRIDQEIEEILGKFEENQEFNHLKKNENGKFIRKSPNPLRFLRGRISSRYLMISGIAFLLTALFLNMFENIPVGPFLILGIISFIGGYALFISRTGAKYELKWRGQSVDYKQNQSRRRRFF